MKIAAVQHRTRADAQADAHALARAAATACDRGAELIVFPQVASLQRDGGIGLDLLATLLRDVPATHILPSADADARSWSTTRPLGQSLSRDGSGSACVLVGDACMDRAELVRAAQTAPVLAVLSPRSETDLQAEAMLEYAVSLSDSLAGLVIVAECAGAEPLEPGHGGTAIVLLGAVAAEALGDDDVIFADVPLPVPQPSPREPVPPVPPLLAQRVALHNGALPAEHGPDLS